MDNMQPGRAASGPELAVTMVTAALEGDVTEFITPVARPYPNQALSGCLGHSDNWPWSPSGSAASCSHWAALTWAVLLVTRAGQG